MGWTSLPLLKTTTMKKGKRKPRSQDEEMPLLKSTKGNKVKDKVRPALLVLTLTDEQAALAAPESNQLPHLLLRKRYYAEVLDFMRMVEGAM